MANTDLWILEYHYTLSLATTLWFRDERLVFLLPAEGLKVTVAVANHIISHPLAVT